jgi:hypothetical protein
MEKKAILTVLKAEGNSADTGAGKFPLAPMGVLAPGSHHLSNPSSCPYTPTHTVSYTHTHHTTHVNKFIISKKRDNSPQPKQIND